MTGPVVRGQATAPGDLYGDAVFTRHYDQETGDEWVTCDHADPRIRISDHLLHIIASGKEAEVKPAATLALMNGMPSRRKPERPEDLFGAVLHIDCANRQLVYRITGFEPVWLENGEWNGSYLAEWPDL